jgi:hypothetical protein
MTYTELASQMMTDALQRCDVSVRLCLVFVYAKESEMKTWIAVGAAGSLVLGIMATSAQAVPITRSGADPGQPQQVPSFSTRSLPATVGGAKGGDTARGMAGSAPITIAAGAATTMNTIPTNCPWLPRWWDEMLRENRAGNSGGGRNPSTGEVSGVRDNRRVSPAVATLAMRR